MHRPGTLGFKDKVSAHASVCTGEAILKQGLTPHSSFSPEAASHHLSHSLTLEHDDF